VTDQPVEAVFLWRLDEDTPFKAVYGRVSGSTTYTKDYLQLRRAECSVLMDRVIGRQEGTTLPLTYQWPGGSTTGELRSATDHDPAADNYRLQLAWPTDSSPAPWQLGDPTLDPVVTVPGTPGPHGAKVQAVGDAELARLKASNVKPWIVAVKLQGADPVLHLRAFLEAPPPGLERLSADQLPDVIRTYMASMPSGCGAVEGAIVRAPQIHQAISNALTRSPNVLLVGPPGTGKTVALEDFRHLFESGGTALFFDPTKWHDAFAGGGTSATTKARSLVFHPSYSYEEFVLGLYPKPATTGGGVDLEPRPGPLLSLAHWAGDPGRAALLILDEFNRGNAASIFGDTLALLDKEKRRQVGGGGPGATIDRPYQDRTVQVLPEFTAGGTVDLPEKLSLPSSLSILAALNSSDRSVAPLDAALRRRFSIVRVDPDLEVLGQRLGARTPPTRPTLPDPTAWSPTDVADLAVLLLAALNRGIEAILGPDFLLGHALLWDASGDSAEAGIAALAAAFDERVVSSLRMTFADQDEPLGALLGAGSPPTGPTTPFATSPFAYWVAPPPALELVASPRLHFRLAQDLPWADAARAFVALL
jgi:5-methylcytosine-specific restriction protein B